MLTEVAVTIAKSCRRMTSRNGYAYFDWDKLDNVKRFLVGYVEEKCPPMSIYLRNVVKLNEAEYSMEWIKDAFCDWANGLVCEKEYENDALAAIIDESDITSFNYQIVNFTKKTIRVMKVKAFDIHGDHLYAGKIYFEMGPAEDWKMLENVYTEGNKKGRKVMRRLDEQEAIYSHKTWKQILEEFVDEECKEKKVVASSRPVSREDDNERRKQARLVMPFHTNRCMRCNGMIR